MKKIILLFSIITLVLTSCSKDYDDIANPINQTSKPVLVKKIIVTDLTNNTVIKNTEFEYDGKKIVKSTDQSGDVVSYTYTGDVISNIKIYHLDTLVMEYVLTYANNNLTESKCINYSENFAEKRLYTYNPNGTVDFIYYKGDLTTQDTLYKTGSLTIQNDEITGMLMQDFINPNNGRTATHTYDNKKNPNKNIIGANKLNVELDRAIQGSFKNVMSTSAMYASNQLITIDYTYTYNANGYPTSSIRLGSDHYHLKTEYFY